MIEPFLPSSRLRIHRSEHSVSPAGIHLRPIYALDEVKGNPSLRGHATIFWNKSGLKVHVKGGGYGSGSSECEISRAVQYLCNSRWGHIETTREFGLRELQLFEPIPDAFSKVCLYALFLVRSCFAGCIRSPFVLFAEFSVHILVPHSLLPKSMRSCLFQGGAILFSVSFVLF